MEKVKAYGAIGFMSLMFFATIDTIYARALGDYVVGAIGLRAWTGEDQMGIHLSLIYFFILFLLGAYWVEKYAREVLKINKKTVFLLFLGLNAVFYIVTGGVAKNVKANAEGLLTIGFKPTEESEMTYDFENGNYTAFEADIILKNYSDEEKTFYLMITDRYDSELIKIYDLDGEKKLFVLEGNETRRFSIDLENALVESGYIDQYDGGSGWSMLDQIIIYNEDGEVLLDNRKFVGLKL